jgi:hypothetical protein
MLATAAFTLPTNGTPTRGDRRGKPMALKKIVERMAEKPDTLDCPKCGYTNDTSGARTLQVEMRPVLSIIWSNDSGQHPRRKIDI